MVKGKWQRRWGAWLCTECGRMVTLDHRTGRVSQVWPPRRYGRKASNFFLPCKDGAEMNGGSKRRL